MASFWIRSSRMGSCLGFAMAFRLHCSPLTLWLKELPDTGETQQFLGSQNGIFRPRVFFGFVVDSQVGLGWGEELGVLQVVEILVDLCGRKQPPDFCHKRWQFGGEVGMLLRGSH